MKHKISILFISIMLLSLFNTAQAANIVASLDRNQIFLDESFRLVFESDNAVDGEPNFSPLQKDFEILSQSQSTNMSFVNGRYSRKGVWSLNLIAKKSGSLTIPSVFFGKDQSPALRIQIQDPTTAKKQSSKDKDVFIQVEIDEDKAWVQSQIIYSVRLFSRISMSNLRSTEPKTNDPDAIIQQMGNATTFEAFRGGIRYAVHEVRYAVYPQHSGKLTFNPVIFEGQISRGRSQSLFDQFLNTGERKRVRSNTVSVDIEARPSNVKLSEWLPAKRIKLSEEWSEDISQLKNGDPVTRTITITADGNMAENLPDLEMTDIKNLKQYPDKPLLDNKITDHGISGTKQIKVALIPTSAGRFKIPSISLPWWNTKTGRQEVAHLPEKLIQVHGEAAQAITVAPEATNTQTEEISEKPISINTVTQTVSATYWPWLSLFLGTGWLITLSLLFRKKTESVTTKPRHKKIPLQPLEKAVQQHCHNNDANLTKDALLSWAKVRWSHLAINSLSDIAQNVPTELATEINALNSTLYSANASQWQGENLLNIYKQFKKQAPEQCDNDTSPLEPLYKT